MGSCQKVKMAFRLLGRFRSQIGQFRTYASAEGPSAKAGDHGGGMGTWSKLSYFVAFPGVGLCYINAQLKEKEHHAHYEKEEFIPYEHLRIRSKAFPWGDGQKSMFHNKEFNVLPDGWEED